MHIYERILPQMDLGLTCMTCATNAGRSLEFGRLVESVLAGHVESKE